MLFNIDKIDPNQRKLMAQTKDMIQPRPEFPKSSHDIAPLAVGVAFTGEARTGVGGT
jgi:hypothetical protein